MKFFSYALFAVSLFVAVGLWNHINVWVAIAVYWTILCIKNFIDSMR